MRLSEVSGQASFQGTGRCTFLHLQAGYLKAKAALGRSSQFCLKNLKSQVVNLRSSQGQMEKEVVPFRLPLMPLQGHQGAAGLFPLPRSNLDKAKLLKENSERQLCQAPR